MRSLLISMVLASGLAAPASAAPLDDAIAKAVTAMGGAGKLHALGSLVLRGFHYEGDYKPEYATHAADAVMVRMLSGGVGLRVVGCRPEFPGCNGQWGRIVEGWDGTRGWELNWPKQRLIRTVGKAQQALKCGAEFLPLFVDYKARGFTAEWLGPQTVLNRKTVALRVDQAGCSSQTYYFDPVSYDLLMSRAVIPVHARGAMRPTLSVYSKFIAVQGVRWPAVTQSVDMNTGEVLDGVLWSTITGNTIHDARLFDPPATKPAGITAVALTMLDAQQQHRGTAQILALYDRFRATPEGKTADTADDMRWLGFEFLKVDDFSNALALWRRLAAESPKSPLFPEYLGDAYVQKGDAKAAAQSYDRALALGAGDSVKAKRDKLKT
jgi:hypothetical protein